MLGGHAVIDVDGSHSSVAAGSIIYVPRGVPHHFQDVSDDLRGVVVFVPPARLFVGGPSVTGRLPAFGYRGSVADV